MAHLNSLFLNPVILQLDYWCILCIFHFEILLIIRCFQVFRIPLPFFFLTFTFHFFSHVSRHAECGLMIMNCQTTSVVFGGWCILIAFLWVNEAACFWLSKYLPDFLILNVFSSCSLKPQIFFPLQLSAWTFYRGSCFWLSWSV